MYFLNMTDVSNFEPVNYAFSGVEAGRGSLRRTFMEARNPSLGIVIPLNTAKLRPDWPRCPN
jgi:hypothetical protein